MIAEHDPGPELARQRGEAIADVAATPIETPGGGTVRVGTASWTDPTMTAAGVFYPTGADSAEERLQYYAATFPVVEIDATYYALPATRTAELWVARTPPDFVFDVKAYALMTGQGTETRRLPKAIREALPEDLARQGSHLRQGSARRASRCGLGDVPRGPGPAGGPRPARLDPAPVPALVLPIIGEPRRDRGGGRPTATAGVARSSFATRAWLNEKNVDRTLRFLADRNLPLVMVDEPQGFKSSVPPVVAVTSNGARDRPLPWSQCRDLGGARRESGRALSLPLRRDELAEWVPRIRQIATEARETHVLMNNCYANYGTTNAREIALLLEELEGPNRTDCGAKKRRPRSRPSRSTRRPYLTKGDMSKGDTSARSRSWSSGRPRPCHHSPIWSSRPNSAGWRQPGSSRPEPRWPTRQRSLSARSGPFDVTGTVLDGWDERGVDLRTDGHALAWACDCRDGTVGLFCRHAVAVAVVGWRRASARAHGRPVNGRHPSTRHGTAAAADAQAR